MSAKYTIAIDVEITDDADPDQLADDLFEYLMEDPEDLFPQITVVYGVGVRADG